MTNNKSETNKSKSETIRTRRTRRATGDDGLIPLALLLIAGGVGGGSALAWGLLRYLT